ncbi:MAG TPA: nuclear transport factor 2 family protein, partial [Streptosporangiaceae bacterium]|nr:nuclear transport factor 2 family protein [Streptosporangiaceae bacterium]
MAREPATTDTLSAQAKPLMPALQQLKINLARKLGLARDGECLPVDPMTNTDDLAARIRRLEDRLELRELSVRYCRAIDDTDWTAVGALFADQAELGDVTGRDQVVTALRSVRETYGRTVHMAHGLMADFADDGHATGMVPAHAELDIGGET